MRKALVTGDFRVIGTYLCRALSASGEYEVLALTGSAGRMRIFVLVDSR